MSDTPEIELTEAGLNAAADQAVAAFDSATSLEELAVARRDHLGDDAPIPQARRSLGTLPKDQRKDAGRLVNMARGASGSITPRFSPSSRSAARGAAQGREG